MLWVLMKVDLINWIMIVYDKIDRIVCFRMNLHVPTPNSCLEK